MGFGCSKELPLNEYPQHMFWLKYKKNNVQLHPFIWGPVIIAHIISSLTMVTISCCFANDFENSSFVYRQLYSVL